MCVVATSRNYIYRRALLDLKESAFPLLGESQVVIDVQDLTADEKRDILYTHVRRGDQPASFRKAVKPYLEGAARSGDFRPEIARRLGSPLFTKNLGPIDRTSIRKFFESPEDFLVDVIKRLAPPETAALTLLFMHGGSMTSPVVLDDGDRDAIARLGATVENLYQALLALRDSLLRQLDTDEGRCWTFRHPTIADAVGSITAENVELLDIYLRGTPTVKLVREVTCGQEVAGAKVAVPASRYDFVADRVYALRDKWEMRRLVYNFLGNRCGKVFLKRYLERCSIDWKEVVNLTGAAQFRLIRRLIEFELLPSEWRAEFVRVVATRATKLPSSEFFQVDQGAVFTATELAYITSRIREELIPRLDHVIEEWKEDFDPDDDAESHFAELVSTLNDFRSEFVADEYAVASIASALAEIGEAVRELEQEREDRLEEDAQALSSSSDSDFRAEAMRSVFDDVDQ